jgi:hypothetical protein|tara:strand:+ start:153 stop:272 length:120 start_codon:yes stop_codon:yes gene_type:complete
MAKKHLKAAFFTLKEWTKKPMKYYHGIILLGIIVVLILK